MRLLLDEHYSAAIAVQLRQRGHDVVAVQERRELTGLSDRDLLGRAIDDRRALLTEDVRHFTRLAHEFALSGEHHFGIVFTSARSMPRAPDTIGVFVEALDRILSDHAGDEEFLDQTRWVS